MQPGIKKSLFALAFGTFGLGIAEYVMMGILPYLAADFGVSIPKAGYFITAYALGVCVGAPLLVLVARKWPLKRMIYMLMLIYTVAAALMAACPAGGKWTFWLMIFFRFIGGLPHGAYFGVSSIVADKLSKGEDSTLAVAIMCAGMTVANLIGNPFGAFITANLSWRYVFAFAALWGVVTLGAIRRWIPYVEPLPDHGMKGEFRFLKTSAPWLLIMATLLGNGGVFCWYSYISPLLTEVSGVAPAHMSMMMVLAGAGMVFGNLSGGSLADRFGPAHTGRALQYLMLVCLTAIFLFGQYKLVTIPLMIITCGCLFGVSSPQQLLILRYSEGGMLMGGAMVQVAFNLGNALGAWCGGLPIEAGLSYRYPALVGCVFVILGIVCYTVFVRKFERRPAGK